MEKKICSIVILILSILLFKDWKTHKLCSYPSICILFVLFRLFSIYLLSPKSIMQTIVFFSFFFFFLFFFHQRFSLQMAEVLSPQYKFAGSTLLEGPEAEVEWFLAGCGELRLPDDVRHSSWIPATIQRLPRLHALK